MSYRAGGSKELDAVTAQLIALEKRQRRLKPGTKAAAAAAIEHRALWSRYEALSAPSWESTLAKIKASNADKNPRRRSPQKGRRAATKATPNKPTRSAIAELDQAARRFQRFHDRDPRKGEIVTVKMNGSTGALVIGKLDAVLYSVEGGEAPYFHRFKKSARPLLLCSSDGKQAYIFGGGYRFTARGFIG